MQVEMSKRLLLSWQQEKYFPVLFRSIFRTHHGCFSTVEKATLEHHKMGASLYKF